MSTLDVDTVTRVAEEKPEVLKKLTVRDKDIDFIDDLSACVELERLDASQNAIEEASGLKGCLKLTWLNLATNKLTSMHFVYRMKNLTVLNIGNNLVEDMSPVSNLTKLKALILNKNRISEVCDLHKLKSLNTLVLSHNAISDIDVSSLGALTKLQLSHNCLRKFPDIAENEELKQLSLNDNKIHKIPARCIGDNMRLEIVDLGKNELNLLVSLKRLSHIHSLRQLNLRGNELCDNERYHSKIRKWFTNLEVLDTRPFAETSTKTPLTEQRDGKKRKRRDLDLEDDDSKKRMKTEKKTKPLQESPAMNGDKSKKRRKKDAEAKTEVVLPPDTAVRLNKEDLANDGSGRTDTGQCPATSRDQKRKGVSALKEKKSGVVAIKRVKKKGKHKGAMGDVIADISCSLDVGSGVGSSW